MLPFLTCVHLFSNFITLSLEDCVLMGKTSLLPCICYSNAMKWLILFDGAFCAWVDKQLSFFFFLHCMLNFSLWSKLFRLTSLDWVPLRSINDMMSISNRSLGNFIRGKVLRQITCLSMIWIVWRKTNARIFKDKKRTSETLWDLIHLHSSF